MSIKYILEQSYFARCAYYLLTDYLGKSRYKKGSIETNSGTIHAGKSVAESLAYIDEVFRDYKYYAGIERFYGKIAEVGPGDNCGVAMRFVDDGCDLVDLADRFYSKRDAFRQADIYTELLKDCPIAIEKLSGCDLSDESSFKCIRRYYGDRASAESFFCKNGAYDFIVSRAVFEHMFDPMKALSKMVSALRPNGMLLHKIDLRDHGMFSTYFHELKFLEVPDFIYRKMTRFSGRPNRFMVDSYRSHMDSLDVEYKILVTRLVGVGEVTPHKLYNEIPASLRDQAIQYVRSVRKSFSRSLSLMTDADLSIAGVFLIAIKRE